MISQKYLNVLEREVAGIVHFNDVFSDRDVDFDAELTTVVRNLGNFSDFMFPIGDRAYLAEYGLNLLDELIEIQRNILNEINTKKNINIENKFSRDSIIAIANIAPRDDKTTEFGKNGNDFYLAITKNYLEVFCVPVNLLKALETRDKVLALYKIPNDSMVLTDGEHEQFRSSIIATMRYFPEKFDPIFEYESQKDLIFAKSNKTHPEIIPVQTKEIEFAFADKFGNVRFSVLNTPSISNLFSGLSYGDRLELKTKEGKKIADVIYVKSLKEIPIGEFGIYKNIADSDSYNAFYLEFVKKSRDCNSEKNSAFDIIKSLDDYVNKEYYLNRS